MDDQTTFHNEISIDRLAEYRRQIVNEIRQSNLSLTETYTVEFGLKEWSWTQHSAHRAVIIQVKNTYIAFTLDLIKESDADKNDISASFVCPQCQWSTESFRDYNKHYLHHYQNEETIVHKCCNLDFDEYVLFCKHLYEKHRNFNPIGINFKRIEKEKMDTYLSDVSYFPSGILTITFDELHKNALSILRNFGKYFVFFWNCQDYATWFLTYHGIPLGEIDHTLTDRITGSLTDSNARRIRDVKKRWHTDDDVRNTNIDEKLGAYATGFICNMDECRYFPPMDKEDLEVHNYVAHKLSEEDRYIQTCRKFVGEKSGDGKFKEDRKFSLFRLRKNDQMSHESLILQPWSIEEDPQPLNHFCRLHLVNTYSNGEEVLAFESEVIKWAGRVEKDHVFDFEQCLPLLYFICTSIVPSLEIDISVGGSCTNYCSSVIESIPQYPSNVTNVSESSNISRFSRFLASASEILQDTVYLLPTFILLSRISSTINPLICSWLMIYLIKMTFLGQLELKSRIKWMFKAKWSEEWRGIMCFLMIPISCLSLFLLSFQGLENPSIIYIALMWFQAFQDPTASKIILEPVHSMLSLSHLDPSFSLSFYEEMEHLILVHGDFCIILLSEISYTLGYYPYIFIQIFIPVLVVASVQYGRRICEISSSSSTVLWYHRFDYSFLVLHSCIAIAGLFISPRKHSFDSVNPLFIFPIVLVVGEYMMFLFDSISNYQDHCFPFEDRIKELEEIAESFNVSKWSLWKEPDVRSVIRKSQRAIQILFFILQLQYLFVLLIIFLFITNILWCYLATVICIHIYSVVFFLFLEFTRNTRSIVFEVETKLNELCG